MRAALSPLRVRPFGRLLASYTVNELGDSIGIVALALLVYAETRDAFATTALFLTLNVGPAFIAPMLTARLDQSALQRVLPRMYVVEAVVFILLAILADSFLLPLILVLGLLDGTLALAGRGLTRAAVAAVLEPADQLRAGNGLLNVGFALASVFGAAIGGLLVGAFGVATALFIDAASFLVIAGILARTALPGVHAERQPTLRRLREGLSFVRRDVRIRLLIVGEGIALALFTLVVPIEVFYARDTLDTDEFGYGLLLAAWGAGMLLGSLLFVVAKRTSLTVLVLGSTAVIGVGYFGMSLTSSLAVACALSVLGGTGNGIQWVSVMTALQQRTPAELQARIVSLLEAINRAAPAIGFVLGGALASAFSPETAFGAAGIAILALVAVAAAVAAALRVFGPQPASGSGLGQDA